MTAFARFDRIDRPKHTALSYNCYISTLVAQLRDNSIADRSRDYN
ncbi:MAG: hypothetical protein WBD58_22540 [Geitlerinemataceae cyanobacterium]